MSETVDSNVAIAIRNLAARFGEREILKDIDLDILRGETFVILGGSGCGKSTLLRMIVGLMKPTRGQIWINGLRMTCLKLSSFKP